MSDSLRKRILVTGGAGYIGSHACKALAQNGYTPVAYDSLVNGHREAVRWGPLEVGDIADRTRLDAVIAHYRPEAVIHFAAYAYVGESVQEPAKYYRNNVAGTLALLEALLHHGIGRIVFSSTCATYGIPERTPIDEDHPQQPINPYGASKAMIERMLQDFDTAYGLRSVSLRYFNAAGADPDGDIGEDHDPETHLIPLALQAALGQREALQIFGTDYPTADGSCIRDYIHVADLAQAHVMALSYLADGGATTAINLGSGHGHSVLEVIETARKVTGRDIPIQLRARRPGDPPILTAAADKAHRLLDWQPRYTDLAETLRHAWHWHRQHAAVGWAKRGVPTKT
ncbi:UDP-glucose 4-epimerase GalE [Thiocapsa marina]|uniref:UDP-glucose 4-epimerase n=1 Tax=Thiocapsa marina 5811 TaxID=768671 RepID=F9UEY8_9GAMM|nr:UDP-glucose 4-epimerase GalE [Thiocapsa marina]EGV17459.1 UDP-glucose 4-epimerase [Thiocapsa marina 5811]